MFCRNLLLGEIDREERERCWYFSQLEALSQKLAQLPRIDTVRHKNTQTHKKEELSQRCFRGRGLVVVV